MSGCVRGSVSEGMTTGDPAAWGSPEFGPKLLGGRYELGDLLGIGGMAVVRLATDLRLGRTVAVKMLRGELAEAPAFQTRFRREARAAAALDHPAVVSVYDAGEGLVASYIVMEYVQGETLRDLVSTGPVDPRRSLEITADVLDALETSHRNGIVHRDIKPANVMLTPSGAVKVMDFGVARAVADMSASLTQTSAVIGTAQYLSPEQARGEDVDARSDVYSTGCMLYELLTGRPPFQGDSAIAVAYQHVREAAQPPSTYAPHLSPDIDAVVMGALAKRPDERYSSAEQMRADLLAVLDGRAGVLPVGAAAGTTAFASHAGAGDDAATTQENPALGGLGATSTDRGRRRRILLVAAAVAVLLAAVGAFALTGLSGDDPQVGQQAEQRTGRREGPGRQSTPTTQVAPDTTDAVETANNDVGEEPDRRTERRPRREEVKTTPTATPQEQKAPVESPEPSEEPEPATTSEPEPTQEETTPEETASETPPAESPEPTPTPTTSSASAAAAEAEVQ